MRRGAVAVLAEDGIDAGEEAIAVIADDNLNNFGNSILCAQLQFTALDRTRSVSEVGRAYSETGTEKLHTAPSPGGLNNWRVEVRLLAKFFGYDSSKRVNSRGTDNLDRIARIGDRYWRT